MTSERVRLLIDHARQVRTHVKSLGEKGYWERLTVLPNSSWRFCRSNRCSAPRWNTIRSYSISA